jgi:DNA mismatch endonuclease, patch repair protein
MRKTPSYQSYRPSSVKASRVASRIKSSNTKAERVLRSTLWRLGFRFRKNVRELPGKPDVVFPRERVAIFCDGDFWHGRNWEERKLKLQRGANAAYWIAKIQANIQRDKHHNEELSELNWKVLRLWETDVLENPGEAAAQIAKILWLTRQENLKRISSRSSCREY